MPVPSWQEMRDRSTRFVLRWQNETRERAWSQTFWGEFFHIFDIDARRVAVFEHLSTRHSTGGHGFMDVFWPRYMAGEQKSRGADLDAAMDQALDYLPSIPPEHLPTLVVVCDFGRFRVRNQVTGETIDLPIEELPRNLRVFSPLLDREETRRYETEEEVNLRATELLALLHDSLRESGYEGHDLRALLTRLVFILFADDSQVWETGLFFDYLILRTSVDGSDLGSALIHLFQVLDTPKERRSRNLDDHLARFEYINGALFSESIRIPDCTRGMRSRLLKACQFDWSAISPAIFGSLFQNVMEDSERRALGAHYTTEQNILRTINPLFMDDLRAELEAANTLPALRRFRDRLPTLRFFDPACGCGNFLVIAYRELRRLELEVLRRIRAREKSTGQLGMDVRWEASVRVGQFYGIEIEEFPARIAETAIYLVDHLENLALSAEFGQYYARFPITDSAHVTIGNALRLDWSSVLLPEACDFLLGNPPFVGKYLRTPEQTADLVAAHPGLKSAGLLDYVTGWYAKAAEYMRGTPIRAAFVSTNSITQGEQVPLLWSHMRDAGIEIDFAHRTFGWTSEARGSAHVHVVIIGFSFGGQARRKVLFDYPSLKAEPVVSSVAQINPYLVEAPFTVVDRQTRPLLAGLPAATFGSKPTDGGHLLIGPDEIDAAKADAIAIKYIRPFIGATELLYDVPRWCLWLRDAPSQDLRNSAFIRTRLAAVRDARLASKKAATRALAEMPTRFEVDNQPDQDYLALPQTSSERRRFLPAKLCSRDVVPNNGVVIVPGADLWLFGVYNSSMFNAWVRAVSGRLKSDLQISPRMVCNTFPFPEPDAPQRPKIEAAAQAILAARAGQPDASLAVLYDPLAMPPDLLHAHQEVDRAVDASYGRARYLGDAARLHALFERYVALTTADMLPGVAPAAPRRRRART